MDTLKAILIFNLVLEKGSMSAAAKELGITSSAVSQHIQLLEQHHRIKLLNRTTRKISPTAAGKLLWQGAKKISQTLAETQEALADLQIELTGSVIISLPTGFIDSQAVKRFLTEVKLQHPKIQLELIPDDHIADLMNERIDIAIRAAEPDPNSSLVARYLTKWQLCICASPTYLAEKQINNVTDLLSLDWIKYNETVFRNTLSSLGLEGVSPKNSCICSSITASKSLAISGFGLTIQLSGEIEQSLASKELVIVLPEIELPYYNLYAVTAHRTQSAKIQAILQLLKQSFTEINS